MRRSHRSRISFARLALPRLRTHQRAYREISTGVPQR
jgi:hypothetical protein